MIRENERKPQNKMIMGQTVVALSTHQRIKEIEGLRGLLAWWVVVGHIAGQSGTYYFPGILQILKIGTLPVDLFIIISGFSIFCLFEKSKENYILYLMRRFFRLYPVYICCFIAGILVIKIENQNLLISKNFFNPYAFRFPYDRNIEVLNNAIPNIITHFTLVHGLIPRSILPSGSVAFLPPAWVISLEWQFYLIAPLVLFFIKKGKATIIILLCAVFVAFCWRQHLPKIDNDASLPFFVEYFGVGILSFYIFKLVRDNKYFFKSFFQVFPLAGSLFIIFLNIKFPSFGDIIPLSIWFVFFVFLIETNIFAESKLGTIYSSIFNSSALQFLGKLSYSTYNIHIIIIIIVQYILLHIFHINSISKLFIMTFLFTVPLTIIGSHYCFKYIEEPCLQLGNFLRCKFIKKERG